MVTGVETDPQMMLPGGLDSALRPVQTVGDALPQTRTRLREQGHHVRRAVPQAVRLRFQSQAQVPPRPFADFSKPQGRPGQVAEKVQQRILLPAT